MLFGRSGILALALVAVCAAPVLAQVPGGYQTNFDSSTGWTFSGGASGVAWGVDATPSSVAAQTPTNSMNYNNGTNFASGSTTNTGTATSSTISLSGLTSPTLTFYCNFQTEPGSEDATYGYDKRWITITPGTGSAINEQLAVTSGGATVGACSAMGTWHQHTIPLQTSWGTVKVAFKFDTVDGIDNAYAGWFIDTFKVAGSGGGGGGGGTTTIDVKKWNFDDGLQSWTVQNSTSTVKWAADATPATVVGAQAFVSSPNSLNYNNGTSIASGSTANNGTATSPEVDLASLNTPKLVFQCNFQAETSSSYDKRFLQISKDSFSTTVFDKQLLISNADPSVGNCSAAGTWHSHTVTLDPAWGKVKFRVKMDTIDGAANTGAGWFVDDVKVQAVGSTGGSTETTYEYKPVASWNFDTGTYANQGWEVQSTDAFVIWNGDPSPAEVAGGASYFSPPNSLNYNNGTNYEAKFVSNGTTYSVTNSGTATSPEVDLTNESSPRLTFWCNFMTEASTASDKRTLQISGNNFATTVLSAQLLLSGAGSNIGNCSVPGTWHKHTVTLDPSWGKIRLRVKFDTVSASNNGYAGWFVDDFLVEALKPVVAGSFEDGSNKKSDGSDGGCGGYVVQTGGMFPRALSLSLAALLLATLIFLRRTR